LWLRIVDLAQSLGGRKYSSPGSLRLRVRDPLCPWNDGVWELSVDRDGTGHCRQTQSEPELELTASTLSMAYLGGHRFGTLAGSGLVKGSREALQRADALFAWDPLPWCPEFF
jgi:predicted acetyltransferase